MHFKTMSEHWLNNDWTGIEQGLNRDWTAFRLDINWYDIEPLIVTIWMHVIIELVVVCVDLLELEFEGHH